MIRPLAALKSSLSKNIINIPGWRTDRKIVVIESDDWGSIRMPSKETYSRFLEKGFDISGSDYNRLDSLETNEDLLMLFETLDRHKDHVGRSAVITANIVVANPDFRRIEQSGFKDYFYEPVVDTFSRHSGRDQVLSLWKQGCFERIFHPQFHGREHVNTVRWMNALRRRTPDILFSFSNETTFSGNGDYNFMEVLDYNSPSDLVDMKESLDEGLDLFERIFGFRSRSFIPPCYVWDSEIEESLSLSGIKYIQGLVIQSVPTGTFGRYTKKYNFLGKRNEYGQYFLTRNCFFEPSLTRSSDPVSECLDRIKYAFRWRKPAIICSHRINYIGSLVEENRRRNLEHLDELLRKILKIWPETEFVTSDQLGEIIASEKGTQEDYTQVV